MSEAIYKIGMAILLSFAVYDAREAHRHAHELACHVGAVALCEYNDGDDE